MKYKKNSRKIIISLLILALSWISVAQNPQSLSQAYVVIAAGSKSKSETQKMLSSYKESHYPSYGEYPKLLLSDSINGLNPGFWIVVSAICDNKSVATELSAYIRKLNQGAYFRPVQVKKADQLKLLKVTVDEIVNDFNNSPEITEKFVTAPMYWEVKHYNGYESVVIGTSLSEGPGTVIIPYMTDASEVFFNVEYPEDFYNTYIRKLEFCGYEIGMNTFDPPFYQGNLKLDNTAIQDVPVDTLSVRDTECSD